MITFKKIKMKNFLSIGNITQEVSFTNKDLILVLGNNLDLGGNGAKNGVGKTCIINALSFVLFGSAITSIKKDNLINKTNNKDMLVTLEFESNNISYRIERGRRPSIFKFYINNAQIKDDETDEGQGEGRLTQQEIEKVLGMGHTMFKHLIVLNTYTEPFLSMKAADQRDIIEKLLGITLLSEKAIVLKDLIKNTKDKIKEEEYKLKAIEEANEQIQKSIKDIERREKLWYKNNQDSITQLTVSLEELNKVNISEEIENHKKLEEYLKTKSILSDLSKKINEIEKNISNNDKNILQYKKELSSLEESKCYACGQNIQNHSHSELITQRTSKIDLLILENNELNDKKSCLVNEMSNTILSDAQPTTFYKNVSQAYEHRSLIQNVETQLNSKSNEENPYIEQINNLRKNGIKKISFDHLNELNTMKDHQEFLLKLLTNKDSFIRKKIIEQNIIYLNSRLEHYLNKLGLPHKVIFQSDLNVEITDLGRDLDFDNLSRGERNRLILGLSWSFRDVFESMNTPINFMAIDELIDSGLDGNGVEAALETLKLMSRERNKSIFLISHREELIGRVNKILNVTKENGFTTYEMEED
jgi:DNA repair exonuclease SbcCD ATPase subunit